MFQKQPVSSTLTELSHLLLSGASNVLMATRLVNGNRPYLTNRRIDIL